MALLCVSLLFSASTAQACHAHDALLRSADGKAHVAAPVDECPLCAAPHAALAAETHTTVERTPGTETIIPTLAGQSRLTDLPFHLFSRPPPSDPAASPRQGQV